MATYPQETRPYTSPFDTRHEGEEKWVCSSQPFTPTHSTSPDTSNSYYLLVVDVVILLLLLLILLASCIVALESAACRT